MPIFSLTYIFTIWSKKIFSVLIILWLLNPPHTYDALLNISCVFTFTCLYFHVCGWICKNNQVYSIVNCNHISSQGVPIRQIILIQIHLKMLRENPFHSLSTAGPYFIFGCVDRYTLMQTRKVPDILLVPFILKRFFWKKYSRYRRSGTCVVCIMVLHTYK